MCKYSNNIRHFTAIFLHSPDLGYASAVVLDHKDYYPRFGYRPADGFSIEFRVSSLLETKKVVKNLDHFCGADGTRTRDLRRDRPAF